MSSSTLCITFHNLTMCRITGIWDKRKLENLLRTCMGMRDTMTYGGPDDAGMYIDEAACLAMGHRRLSIIDLSPTGHQPMTTLDGRYTICYNGEVYNYRELKPELEAQGFTFRGTSDTEVVLNAFAAWGSSSVDRLIGMFAYAIWDSLEKSLYLFRDRMGVKPLYYYQHEGRFAFASELKGLHAALKEYLEIDREALGEFFHYGYISSPRSIYRNTFKMEPGAWIRVNEKGEVEKHIYWSQDAVCMQPELRGSEQYLIDRLEALMVDAFSKRLIADVPVGVFLSGGIDSSLVTAVLARNTGTPIKTFTIGFREKNYDESSWARAIADYLRTEHTEETVTPDHARAILPLWPEIYDEPFGDISGIPTTIVSRMTRKYVKVSLSADGGDELFCGYHRYWVMEMLQRYLSPLPASIPRAMGKALGFIGADTAADLASTHPGLRLPAIKDRMRKFQAVLANWEGDAGGAYPYALAYWLPQEISSLMGTYHNPRPSLKETGRSLLSAMMLWDMRHYLSEDILTKVDRATMSTSLEGRDPFLDHRIVEFALRLPMEFKYQRGKMKYILRKVLERYLPAHLFERPKQGFAVPIYSWLHDELMGLVEEYLSPESLSGQAEIDPALVLKTVSAFKGKNGSVAVDRIWLLLAFMMWRRHYCG
ncbi:MAG TPA: asparagine synthase (glutamine-hydrolyzing) [Desulfomonilia bacterium]|nr:asparagine synthase (glutamine-hydrolyzing) [Desulfomonilia bacterium]